MYTKDKVEKMEPSAEVKEKEEEEEEGEADAGDEEDGDDEEQEDRGDKEKEEKAMPQAADKIEKNIPLPIQPREKKQAEGLNLNNEVVKMRKEVKRVRALIIRKLTRQIGGLKKKKGTETEKERNQRRAARLLEEIHAMKVLLPDLVTKTALQKNLNFEQECKNPKSTISDRAVARIATHPQFNKKIKDIKAAVNAFKQERMKGGQQGGNEKVQNKAGKVTPQSPDKKGERQSKKEEEDIKVEQKEIIDNEERDGILKDTKDASVAKPGKEPGKATHSADNADARRKEMPQNERPASIKSSEVKDIVKNKPQSKYAEKRPDHTSAPEVLQKKKDEEESDLELSDDEEKEYFDDSTEERFHKQSSQSEESDDDDFFVGRVSKFKKKKQKSKEGESVGKGHEVKADPTDQVQSRLDELESRLKSKGSSLQSVFCSSLSASKPGGGRGAGRGRGGDTFRGQGKPKGGRGLNRDFSKQSKFQNQETDTERKPGSKYSKPRPEGRHPELAEKGFPSGRGRGRGRGDAFRQKDHRGGGAFSHQAPQQALHPSWEASKKRKEQQGQILAFQGKKIKFDDND
ncbi:serum response factor-binding protein 1 [Siniperca chuatsi]|uniref:serum response factor-binding protein 1 n=1 Tax=Siniperca chuatsi TaxID=119488 RepID=UPI001CE1490C|nr:serum response factor-binding protein 1 [Siniperca chuatsi]XP_044028434.1 serum response factor-binding protein 1 [Siniperca chuatsi]